MITGEPVPVTKRPGDGVTGGTLNATGSFVMRIAATGRDTTLSKIVEMVGQAQRSRVPIQKLVALVRAGGRAGTGRLAVRQPAAGDHHGGERAALRLRSTRL